MKPFDLTRAIAGEPLVTRSGKLATSFVHMALATIVHRNVVVIDGHIELVSDSGAANDGYTSSSDLFMAPRKRTVYVNLYKRGANHECAYHDTEDFAIQMTSGAEDWLIARAVPVEIEE